MARSTDPTKSQVFLAEFIATFALCFAGILAINAAGANLVGIAFAHGLTILVMIAAIGGISGGHINPAVTFGFVITGRMNIATGLLYWVAQLSGAAVAGFLLLGILGTEGVAGGTPQLAPDVTVMNAILLEAVTTFFLVYVIFGTAVDERAPKSVFPIAIGLTVALDILAIGPLTGGAMNPARFTGPALASGMWDNTLVYWVGPLLGGGLAALVQQFAFLTKAPDSAVAEHGGTSRGEERN